MRKNKAFHPQSESTEQLVMLRRPVTDPELKDALAQAIIDCCAEFDGDIVICDKRRYFVDLSRDVFEEIFD